MSYDAIQKLTGIKLPISQLSYGGKSKKQTYIKFTTIIYRKGQIYNNSSLSQTDELEAELIKFDLDVESKSDDIMDAAAYMVNKWFDDDLENDGYYDYVDERLGIIKLKVEHENDKFIYFLAF